ncbi:hypothetical protein AK830_g8999 [Neonectria ditissima]|uniref:Uncharacterized protein n=1 Tax=Neonectria ditissima TaxID=78410 RepID=A0A0N8H5Z9_9HYPO|nr:hypothetical protein AK830_g8999 [Neonectria ditissima]
MGSENRSIARYETTAVYTHPEAKVDIVLVHGLNGSPDKTWKAKNDMFWPLDLLPASLKGVQANIMVYGYNADVYSKRNDQSASDNFIQQHAQTLVTNLTLYRRSEGTFKNPIIWVCHSLGGILVKRALLYSNDLRAAHHEDHRSIYVSTFGLIFLGTPHTGSDGATWGIMLQAMSDAIIPRKFFESESVLLRTLKKDNETLANINSHFLDIYQRFHIHMAHENHKTDVKGTKVLIVDANSASPQLPGVTYYGIEATHTGMCKFDGPSAPGYRNISTDIRQWVVDAPAVVQVRWEVEEEERRARMRNEISERMSPYADPVDHQAHGHADQAPLTFIKDQTASRPVRLEAPEPIPQAIDEPLFIHPERFRPNSYFRGRGQELKDLHRMLMDKGRRDQGTSAVLIWAVPGGGKSHLAREYAFRHRHDYPGGVFWIRGKAQEDLEDGFLKMAKSAAIREGIRVKDECDLRDPTRAIPLVRKWLNRSEDWLLILDGVLHDTPGLSNYIPDAKHTSLILTSTDTSMAGNHKFDSPQKIELGPLDEEDAQIMLLEEMDKKKPWTQDDRSRALEAVLLMECLPLAVHAAARQLRATREPLSKYIRSYKNRPPTGGLGAYKGVRDKLQERGETAALNLMYLLSFFSGRVPVEMLALGLRALDKRTPVRTHDSMGKRSLNKTFTVLIAFALIERDEIEDAPSATATSPDSSHSGPPSTELLDMLKIHSIVQTFFRESLKKEKNQYEFWLERAAAVFCKSFDEGDSRARENPEMGLPDDYRRYAAHARKILEHIARVDRPAAELRVAEQALRRRLGDIQGHVSTVSRATTTGETERRAKDPHVSVFERTNSLSVPSSVTTTDSQSDEPGGLGPQLAWNHQASLPLDANPHHYHVPYPQDDPIPAPAFVHDGQVGDWNAGPSQHEAQDVSESHRTVRRQAAKRYYDRAGAWRETKKKVNEPRVVSISREFAVGQFSPAVSTLSQLVGSRTGGSSPVFTDAGQHLARLQSASQHGLGDADLKSEAETVGAAQGGPALQEHVGSVGNFNRGRARGNSSLSMPADLDRSRLRAQISHHHHQDAFDEDPFFDGSSFGAASIPSIHHHQEDWRPGSHDGPQPRHSPTSHSDSYLDTEVGQWAPHGLPIVVSSTSSLGPAVHPHHHARDSGYAGETFSNSLPSSQTTLQPPPHWRPSSLNPDGYSSQPLSRNASSNHEPSGAPSQTLPIQTRRAPSMARTEPSPRIAGFESPPTSYRAWQQRHAGPWSPERVEADAGEDGTEMVRSGSGGIQFNGRIVEFGQSPLSEAVYPLEIAESEPLWEDDEVPGPRSRPLGLGIVKKNREQRRQSP